MTNQWIDTHVHLFPETDAKKELPRLAFAQNQVNTPSVYRAVNENKPSGVVVVHFSKAPDSVHVIETLDGLAPNCTLPMAGIIKADVTDPRTFDWVKRPDIAGVRVYAKEGPCDFSDKAAWDKLWNLVRSHKKHVLVFGAAPYLREAIAQIPQDIPLVIDHLGLPDATKGASDPAFCTLLAEMHTRNATAAPVYYKGPGYRSSLDVHKMQPFVNAIAAKLGVERLMLGASDGPFAGPALEADVRYHGKPLSTLVDYGWMNRYTETLAEGVAKALSLNEQDVKFRTLYRNAAELYGF
jgi:predicted TIM-barrel fold metal-dependent hydrolase